MNHKILFRGKRIDNGEWVHGTLFEISDAHNPFIMFKNQHGVSEQVSRETVGQYTGLKDADGKRIFEGDVVVQYTPPIRRWPERYGKRYCVEMDDGRRGWWPFACGDGCGCCEDDTIAPYECKVLGNIHDNPELMEVQQDE